MPESARASTVVAWIAVVFAVIAIGLGAFVFFKPQPATNNAVVTPANLTNVTNAANEQTNNVNVSTNSTLTNNVPTNAVNSPAAQTTATYKNTNYGFSLEYPSTWVGAYRSNGKSSNPDSIDVGNEKLVGQQPPSKTYQGVNIDVFKKGYVLPCGTADCSNQETLSATTDLVHFVRIMQGLAPDEVFASVTKNTRTIGGMTAIKFVGTSTDPSGSHATFDTPWTLKSGSTFIMFNPLSGNVVSSAAFTATFEAILTSFKFTS